MDEMILGIIGGSGLYDFDGMEEIQTVSVDTPFGKPSDEYRIGKLGKTKIVFLARHGKGHRLMPSEINYRANIWGLKKLGCTRVVSVTAVGSMKENIAPGDIVLVDQFFDRTRLRNSTFFGDGLVAHVAFADPVCTDLSSLIFRSGQKTEGKFHFGGTYLCIEGPQFSTKAESRIFRQWGVDVIGMTNLPEARLAREAELCYGVMALATDYDCWHGAEEAVSAPAVLAVMKRNIDRAKEVIQNLARTLTTSRNCNCATALDGAIMSNTDNLSEELKERLALLLARQKSAQFYGR